MKKEAKEAAAAFGRFGGKATLKKYGRDHYAKLARKRWAKKRGS